MNDRYTPEEFATAYSLRGYGKKAKALEWMKSQGIAYATESTFEKCYYDLRNRKVIKHRVKGAAMTIDCQNMSAPEHMKGGSYGTENDVSTLARSGALRNVSRSSSAGEVEV